MIVVVQVVVKVEMLICCFIVEVFEVFVDLVIIVRFWFSCGDVCFEVGKWLCWYWDMYGVFQEIEVKDL